MNKSREVTFIILIVSKVQCKSSTWNKSR